MEMQPPIELEIQDLSRGGAGVARDSSGRVIFVPFTAPGDRVLVRVIEQRKQNYAQGELLEVRSPSSIRQKAPCRVFSRCGGCQWQHIPYEQQWRTKGRGVLHALTRVGLGQHWEHRWSEFPAEQIWEYRNRVQLRGFREEIGFYAAGSHEVIPIERCEIARTEINEVLSQTRTEGASRSRPYKVEIAVSPDGQIRKVWNAGHGAAGFRQIHDAQNEKLKNWVRSVLTPGLPLLDLYGGSGNLSLGLAERSPEIHCVDIGVPRERPEGTPTNLQFHRSEVLPWIKMAAGKPEYLKTASWAAISDPPREGLGQDFSQIEASLRKLGVRELAAVGCDPDSWARDVSRFVRRGWSLEKVAAFDFFPQTPHVEAAALLKFD